MRKRRDHGLTHDTSPTGSSAGIDLAPMLDFVVNLLIFFIITAVFVRDSGVQVNRPNAIANAPTEEAKGVEILASGEIRFDGKKIDLRAVRANAERVRAVKPDSGLLIIANEGAPTGTLVEVVDELHLGGIYDITFSTTK
jgi:biopolymer transport protein ExbD